MLKPMQKTQELPKYSWELTSLRFNPITLFFEVSTFEPFNLLFELIVFCFGDKLLSTYSIDALPNTKSEMLSKFISFKTSKFEILELKFSTPPSLEFKEFILVVKSLFSYDITSVEILLFKLILFCLLLNKVSIWNWMD
jgi:hypothetical protein